MGLGNPGPRYRLTRHNAGFWFLDRWAGLLGLSFRKPWFQPFEFCETRRGSDRLVLVKPLTFVNRSGLILERVLGKFDAAPGDLLVVFDQMDLPPGRLRMKPHGSSAGHNGLKSIEAALGNQDYHRLALGVGRPTRSDEVVDHVLGGLSAEEAAATQTLLDWAVPLAHSLWSDRWEVLIHAFNQRDRHPPSDPR